MRSRTGRVLWYLLIVTPALALVAGISANVTARSADEALGQVFVVLPFLAATVLLAVIVLVATLRSKTMAHEERRASLVVCGSVLPMLVLVWITPALLGGWPRGEHWLVSAMGLTLVNMGWIALLITARRKTQKPLPPA